MAERAEMLGVGQRAMGFSIYTDMLPLGSGRAEEANMSRPSVDAHENMVQVIEREWGCDIPLEVPAEYWCVHLTLHILDLVPRCNSLLSSSEQQYAVLCDSIVRAWCPAIPSCPSQQACVPQR